MKYSILLLASVLLLLHSCKEENTVPYVPFAWNVDSTNYNLAKYVDPMIGTDGHGHTFPGACAPFGMVQLSPDTRIDGSWDGCSGYHYSDDTIYGFSHTHLSGTGCSDYGDIMFMPGIEEPQYTNGTDGKPGYAEGFSHDNEDASAGYYKVQLNNAITCEMTASPRVGLHKYTFPNGNKAWIVLDMSHRDEVLECELEIVDDHTIRGKRFSKAWAQNQQLWFYAEFSKPFKHTMWSEGNTFAANSSTAKDVKVVFEFGDALSEPVEVKVALSPVSWENAKLNMQVETQGNWFDWVRAKTLQHWESELGRIEVTSDDVHKLRTFYTALYHCYIAPNVYCDVNGDYRGMDHKVYRDTVHQRYTVFSLWDTYRALHPLFTIIQQKRTNDFINTFLQQYKESGRLPVWELSSNETDCMIGYHSVSVIADAWMKGITDYDTALAYEAMKASAMENRSGLEAYRKYGFIPAEEESESVSRTLEYAYDDWCISRCAHRTNDTIGQKYFEHRSKNWLNVYNPETGFMQARMNNSFFTPFNPFEVNNNYTEANAWQYSLAVQHDHFALAYIKGFKEYENHLDSMFHVSSKTAGREQADISGLIGQYAHGNEPSHHMAYLYCGIYKLHKTQELVHQICNTLYTDQPDGLCGNEDCGQMSAWYVLSSCGFYQVRPGDPDYELGSPQFTTAKFNLENGNVFTIATENTDSNYAYGHVMKKDFIIVSRYLLEQEDIMDGGFLQVKKTKTAKVGDDFDPTVIVDEEVSSPWITGISSRTFVDRVTFGMKTLFPENQIYYSINGGDYVRYTSPIQVSENTEVRMFTVGNIYEYPEPTDIIDLFSKQPVRKVVGHVNSDTAVANFFKAPAWKSIAIRNAYAPQYSAGGDRALIDGLTGTTNFRTGLWQGYEGVEMDVIIDLGKETQVDSVVVGFLTDTKSWIFRPWSVTAIVSNDSTIQDSAMGNTMQFYGNASDEELHISRVRIAGGTGRYVRVITESERVCPPGHPGEGKPAWLFADEITIKTK